MCPSVCPSKHISSISLHLTPSYTRPLSWTVWGFLHCDFIGGGFIYLFIFGFFNEDWKLSLYLTISQMGSIHLGFTTCSVQSSTKQQISFCPFFVVVDLEVSLILDSRVCRSESFWLGTNMSVLFALTCTLFHSDSSEIIYRECPCARESTINESQTV